MTDALEPINMNTAFQTSIVLWLVALGCGGSGTRPHDASAASHARTAAQHDASASELETRCDQRDRIEPTVSAARPSYVGAIAPCWKGENAKSVDEHRRAAADHRAASAALQNAEASACVGISVADRDMGPFEHPSDVSRVEPFIQSTGNSKGAQARQVGAIVTFRAVPGMTTEWLQRSVDCQLARNAALGHVVPEMPDCPLVPNGVEAHVRSVGNGFAVEIKSNDPDTAREILARAKRFAAPTTTSGR